MLDPVYGKIAAQNIAAGLSRNFPQHQQAFEKNLKAYLAELDDWIARWKKWRLDYAALNMSSTIPSGFTLPIDWAGTGG